MEKELTENVKSLLRQTYIRYRQKAIEFDHSKLLLEGWSEEEILKMVKLIIEKHMNEFFEKAFSKVFMDSDKVSAIEKEEIRKKIFLFLSEVEREIHQQ